VPFKTDRLTFQGGFVAQSFVCLVGVDSIDSLIEIGEFEALDNNEEQIFVMLQQESKLNVQFLKLLFNSSSDFYGRITIYKLEIYGDHIPTEVECK